MKAEKAELFELFLHDEHGIGLVEFIDYDQRSISRNNGIKLISGNKTHYISENRIDSYKLSYFNSIDERKYIIACTELDSEYAVNIFREYMIEKCNQQIKAHERAFDKFGLLNTWGKRLELLKNPPNGLN